MFKCDPLFSPNPEPVKSPLSFPSSSNTGLRIDDANSRVTFVYADSLSYYYSDASRTSTTSSDKVEIHATVAVTGRVWLVTLCIL